MEKAMNCGETGGENRARALSGEGDHPERLDTAWASFQAVCAPLFSATAWPGEQREAVHGLFDLLAGIVGYDDDTPRESETRDTYLPSGKAIAFQGAARCLWEYVRTSKFLRGVELALRTAQARFPGQRLRLLEAGCGPFALLALPLATRFRPEEVGFTLLDIHAQALAAARRIVQTLGLEAYVDDYVQADAATWRCPEDRRPHVIVSETMQNGLKNEPQVMITENLAPQRLAGGHFLPEAVTLDFALLVARRGENDVTTQDIQRIARLYELTPDEPTRLATGRFTLPDSLPAGARPAIATRIRVFGDILLDDNECSLTLPLRRKEWSGCAAGDVVEFAYRRGPQPGMWLSRLAGG